MAHRADLGLGGSEAGDRHPFRLEAEVGVGLVQVSRGVAHHRREDDVRRSGANVAHDRDEILTAGAQAQIALADNLAAVVVQQFAHDPVGLVRIDVVGADEVEACAVALHQEAAQLDTVLVGRRPGVDDVGRELEALVKCRIPQQPVQALDHGQRRLPTARRVAAEDRGDTVLDHQFLGVTAEGCGLGGRIIEDRLERTAVDAAGLVDLLDGSQRAAKLRLLDHRHEAGARKKHADPPRLRSSLFALHRPLRMRASRSGNALPRRHIVPPTVGDFN